MQPESPQNLNPPTGATNSAVAPEQPGIPQNNTSASTDPGKVLGIVSIVLSLIGLGLFGLICGIIGLNKSKKAGHSNTPAIVGIILSAISMVIGVIVGIVLVMAVSSTVQKCQELGPGVHYEGNTTYTCS